MNPPNLLFNTHRQHIHTLKRFTPTLTTPTPPHTSSHTYSNADTHTHTHTLKCTRTHTHTQKRTNSLSHTVLGSGPECVFISKTSHPYVCVCVLIHLCSYPKPHIHMCVC